MSFEIFPDDEETKEDFYVKQEKALKKLKVKHYDRRIDLKDSMKEYDINELWREAMEWIKSGRLHRFRVTRIKTITDISHVDAFTKREGTIIYILY